MRTIKNLLWAVLPLFCLSLAVSCTEDKPVDENPGGDNEQPSVVKDTVIKMKKDICEVSVAGGNVLVEYTIEALDGGENPHSGEKISAVASESWVSGFNYNTSNILRFAVEANPGSTPREAVVTVKYRYADDVAFIVKQNAKSSAAFVIQNINPTMFDYTVDIIPEDKETPYIVMSADPKYIIQSGFTSPEDLYYDDVAYFAWMGSFYGKSSTTIMQERAKFGDQRGVKVSNAAPGTPYTFYCYYFDYATGALLSDVHTVEVKTLTPAKQSVEFNIDYEVNSCVVEADVTPVSFDGDYYFDALSVGLVDSYLTDLVRFDGTPYFTTPEEVIEYWWCTAVADMMTSMSFDAILSAYTSKGNFDNGDPKSQYDFELLANHDYYIFSFAMDPATALACSVPQYKKVTTGDVAPSDNEITPSVSNITSRTAVISFETTNDDYYIAGWATAAEWAEYGNNDAERQQHLLATLSYEFISGDYSQSITQLIPETEYVLYAFGSRGGVATTPTISTVRFTTKAGSGGACTMTFADLGYYDGSDFGQYDGYEFLTSYEIVMPIEVQFSTPDHGAYFFNVYDWTNREYEAYDDENYTANLVWHINTYGSLTATHTYMILENNKYYEMIGLVVDAEGVFSDLAKVQIRTSYDNCRDAEAFVEWWDAYQNGQNEPGLQSCVVEEKTLFSKKDASRKRVSEMTFEVSKMDINK